MKKVLLIFCFILLGSPLVFADSQQTPPAAKGAVSDLFEKTLQYVDTNPQFVESMINEIQNSPELSNLLEYVSSSEDTFTDVDFSDSRVFAYIDEKINDSTEFVQKVILNFGQSKQFASELAEEDSVRDYLRKKAENDVSFRKQLFMLLPKKDQKQLQESLSTPLAEEAPPEEKIQEDGTTEEQNLK